jgi:hypothetical protein
LNSKSKHQKDVNDGLDEGRARHNVYTVHLSKFTGATLVSVGVNATMLVIGVMVSHVVVTCCCRLSRVMHLARARSRSSLQLSSTNCMFHASSGFRVWSLMSLWASLSLHLMMVRRALEWFAIQWLPWFDFVSHCTIVTAHLCPTALLSHCRQASDRERGWPSATQPGACFI